MHIPGPETALKCLEAEILQFLTLVSCMAQHCTADAAKRSKTTQLEEFRKKR